MRIFKFDLYNKDDYRQDRKDIAYLKLLTDKIGSISISILSPLGFFMSSRNGARFFCNVSSHREHNAVRLVTISKWQVIRSSSVIGYDDKKKKFATQTCSGKIFFLISIEIGLRLILR